jgi:hypothetical protein
MRSITSGFISPAACPAMLDGPLLALHRQQKLEYPLHALRLEQVREIHRRAVQRLRVLSLANTPGARVGHCALYTMSFFQSSGEDFFFWNTSISVSYTS